MKKNRGFTFLELLVTVAVIGLAIIPLYLSFTYGLKVHNKAKNLALSYEIANKEMETIRSTPFANLTNRTNASFICSCTADLALLSGGQGQLTIADYNTTSIKKITIKVNWTEYGTQKQTIITSLVTSGGINP